MKSLLRFFLMISLVVAGKLVRQMEPVPAQAPSARTTWQTPVRSASLTQNQHTVMQKAVRSGDSYFWQATTPTAISTTNIE